MYLTLDQPTAASITDVEEGEKVRRKLGARYVALRHVQEPAIALRLRPPRRTTVYRDVNKAAVDLRSLRSEKSSRRVCHMLCSCSEETHENKPRRVYLHHLDKL